jgi:hypothetical protein
MRYFVHTRLFSMLGLALLAACSGAQAPSSGPTAPASPFTEIPTGSEDPTQLFADADAAFRAGDFVTAQRLFGTLFIVAPSFNGGVGEQGVAATCASMGQDCLFPLARLTFMRDAYYGQFGPMNAWLGQQRQDFDYILDCYEAAMMGDFGGAMTIGSRVLQAPHPAYAFHANQCTSRSRSAMAAIEQERAAEAALAEWRQFAPCMNEHRLTLLSAAVDQTWDTFLSALPSYRACSEPLQRIIDAELLMGDPRLGMEHDLVWSNMSEIDAILEDEGPAIARMQQGLANLGTNPSYQRAAQQWQQLDAREAELLRQRADFERAAAVLSGAARAGVDGQIAGIDADLANVRGEKRDAMAAINAIRRELGLSSIERP